MAPSKVSSSGAEIGENDKIFKTPIFYIYSVWAAIVIAVGLATIGNAAADATMLGHGEGFASLLVGLIATTNGCGRIVIGILFDKTNIKATMFIDALIAVIATALIVIAFVGEIGILYVPGALLCGLSYGGVPVIASAFSRQRYGAKKYPFNLSIVNFAVAVASLINIAIMVCVGTSNRMAVFVAILVLGIIALLNVFLFSRRWDKDLKC
jgi:OFA family oxalate/formate antiporter-like MFS transporter